MGRDNRGKRPITILAGPYGHPFHPLIVTVPIGTWVASIVFDVASRLSDEGETFAEASYWLIGLGVLGALAAAVFGVMDLLAVPRRSRAFRTALTHMTLNVTVVILFAISFLIRRGDYESVSTGLIILSLVALGLLGVSGWLGGKMTYRYGVRVADEETQAEGYAT